MSSFSFIIRFHNEEKYIGECLDAIARQNGGHHMQIIFVNDKSDDNSVKIINEFTRANPKIDVEIINLEKKFTFSSAINKAIPLVNGEYSVIISAHATIATNDWLNIMLKNFEDSKVAITYGRLIVRKDANTQSLMSSLPVSPPYKIIKSAEYFYRSDDARNAFSYINLNTCNVIRSDILKKYQFTELPSVEDMGLGKRIMEDGYKIIYEPLGIVWHSHNDSTEKMVIRWITAAVGMRIIFTGRPPSRISLLKSTIPSFFMFMLKVSIRERNPIMKLVFFTRAFVGSCKIFTKVVFSSVTD